MRMVVTGYTEAGVTVFTQTHYDITTKQLPILITNSSCAEGEVPDRPEVTRVEINIFFKP